METLKLDLLYPVILAVLVATSAGCDETRVPPGAGQSSGERTRSNAGRDDDAGARPGPRGEGGSGGGSSACALSAQRVAPAGTPAQCIDCVCDKIATCGAACEELGMCVVARCSAVLGDPLAANRCASAECGAEIESSDLSSITTAVSALAECRSACQLPDAPGPDADAGASEDAGS